MKAGPATRKQSALKIQCNLLFGFLTVSHVNETIAATRCLVASVSWVTCKILDANSHSPWKAREEQGGTGRGHFDGRRTHASDGLRDDTRSIDARSAPEDEVIEHTGFRETCTSSCERLHLAVVIRTRGVA